MQLLYILINLLDRSTREAQVWEVEKKAETDAQIALVKIKELEAEAKNLQGILGQVESNLTLILEREKEAERRTEEHIQDAKCSSVEDFKASPAFVEEMVQAVEAFKTSEEYRNSHLTFSKKIFHQAHKEDWVDCRKSIEEEHLELDLTSLDYEDEDEDDEEVHIVSKLSIFEKENIAEPSFLYFVAACFWLTSKN